MANEQLIDSLVEAGFSPANARELEPLLGGLGAATVVNGVAVVTIEGSQFALLPVNAGGEVQANIIHRTGLRDSLLALAGSNGEVGVATDTRSLILFNGTPGQAVEIRALGATNALGADSLTLGLGASTSATAVKSLAAGANAQATMSGEVVLGSVIANVQRRFVTAGLRTTTDEYLSLTTDNLEPSVNNAIRVLRDGVYDVETTVIARQIGTNNWARFCRRAVFRKTGNPITMYSETTPTPDVNTGLAGLVVTVSSFSGGYINVGVEGLAGVNIQWTAYLDIREMAITV